MPVSADTGQTVQLRCPTNLSAALDWWQLESPTSPPRFVVSSGFIQNTFKPRFNLGGTSDEGEYTLFIFNVQDGDAGFYVCIEDKGLGKRYGYQLTVSSGMYLFRHLCYFVQINKYINVITVATAAVFSHMTRVV